MEFGISTPLLVGILFGLMVVLQVLFWILADKLGVQAYDVTMTAILLVPGIIVGGVEGLYAGTMVVGFTLANVLLHALVILDRIPSANAGRRLPWRRRR